MCQLSDNDLRHAGTKNTTELMYESFKELNSYYLYDMINSSSQQERNGINDFPLDKDGLELALKYFMCSTLTIRLCGIVQMNLQINAWSEYSSLGLAKAGSRRLGGGKGNELADWFVKNKIVEYLFGPNLHVEVSHKAFRNKYILN